MLKSDVIVIGGGAAGLFCAITAAQRGRQVTVLDHAKRVGRKILMSGGGRCNFTNMYSEPSNFLSQNPHFCRSALSRYPPWDFIALVEKHGIAYHEKELGQLFCDESSKLIVAMLLAECSEAGVEIKTACQIESLEKSDAGFELRTTHGGMTCSSLVIASGGLSIPKMGATGFGYDIAKQFGHSLIPTRAGLVPLTLSGLPQQQFSELPGVSSDVEACVGGNSFNNALLITHRGLSGPAILQISSYWREGDELLIDWWPSGPDGDELVARKREHPREKPSTLLNQALPKRLAEFLLQQHPLDKRLADCRDEELRQWAEQLHAWRIRPSGTEGYRTAEVTLGGVDTTELSSRSMASNLCSDLYFIGEVVDVTGHLGGHNFQWAWASGHAAGQTV
ncbi:MAG: NAD(P)/FAD-dependent oxidoreductase [Oceanococcus sp.]